MKKKGIIIAAIVGAILAGVLINIDAITELFQPKSAITVVDNKKVVEEHSVMQENNNLFYQGEIVNFESGGGYTYIEVKEKTELTFWIVVEQADVEKGDYIRFQKELVAKDYKSKALGKTFDEIMFAMNLEKKVSE